MPMATHDLRLASSVAGNVAFLNKVKSMKRGRREIVDASKRDRTKRFVASFAWLNLGCPNGSQPGCCGPQSAASLETKLDRQ